MARWNGNRISRQAKDCFDKTLATIVWLICLATWQPRQLPSEITRIPYDITIIIIIITMKVIHWGRIFSK